MIYYDEASDWPEPEQDPIIPKPIAWPSAYDMEPMEWDE